MQRILVVEDDFDIQELLQNFLQEAGYEVAVANDGVEALSLFAGQRYDLIVLDIMLPKIDGYGVCELIRKQSDVPIIMLTALSGEEDLLAPGGISHSGPGGNRQLWPDENSQS